MAECADCARELRRRDERAIGMCNFCEARETRFHRLGARIVTHPDGHQTLQWEAGKRR